MFMPLLYNIEKCNNTMTIQSTVSMYTDVSSVLSFSITEGAIWLVSPDLKTLCRPFGLLWRSTVSVHVFAPARGQCLSCISQQRLRKSKEQDTCYSKLRYIHVGICIIKIRSRLHAIM